jgi:ketosteroid isomerase-like protein
MSEANAEVVRRMYAAFHGGDAEGALALFSPDVVVDATIRVDGGIGHGREELNAIIAHWVGAFEEWNEEIHELRELGDRVYVELTQRGRSAGTGIEVESRYAIVYEVRGDLIVHMKMYGDVAEALAAAGGA